MAKQEYRYTLIYDGYDKFVTDDLEAAKKTAIEDTEHYDYIIEIYDSVENRIVWTTDEYFYEKEHNSHRLHSSGR